MNQELYPCPCCGYLTYVAPAGGSMQICEVCFWEDASGEFWYNHSNQVSLFTAQENFAEFGAVEQKYRSLVRAPLAEESRLPGWLTAKEIKLKVTELIYSAFDDVFRDGGVSLHQARVLDDYGDTEDYKSALAKDPERRWQEIPDEKISKFNDSLVFFDPKGVRFYLPAFMIYGLKNYDPTDGGIDADGVFFAALGPSGSYQDCSEILNPLQMSAVAAFLVFAHQYSEHPMCRKEIQALHELWAKHLPAFISL